MQSLYLIIFLGLLILFIAILSKAQDQHFNNKSMEELTEFKLGISSCEDWKVVGLMDNNHVAVIVQGEGGVSNKQALKYHAQLAINNSNAKVGDIVVVKFYKSADIQVPHGGVYSMGSWKEIIEVKKK